MKRIQILLLFAMLLQLPLTAQIPNSMFFMPGVPQSNRINPAIQPGCSFYLGMPLLSPLRLQESLNITYQDIFYYDPDLDMLMLPFHPQRNTQEFIDNLDVTNYSLTSLGFPLASLGFKSGKSYLSFDVSMRMDGNVFYPKGVFELLDQGLADGNTVTLDGLGIDINTFTEFAMGWSRKDFLIPNLDLGVRGKLMFGLANIETTSSTINLSSSRDSTHVDGNFNINVSAPSLVTFTDDIENGIPVSIDESFFDNFSPTAAIPQVFSLDQFGMALDLGLNYRPIPQLLISASVLDLGGITHKNTLNANFDFAYDFTGVEVNPFTGVDSTLVTQLTDSLSNTLANAFTVGDPYMSKLNTKLFVGASFYPIEKVGIGVLSRTDFLGEQIMQQFTGTLNVTTGKFINLTLSYSYISNTFNILGGGLSLNLGPFNMYVISDNAISTAWKPLEAKSLNLWFGMNLTFGWKKAARKAKVYDNPLIL